jgi:ankyrin repeat protein
VNAKQNYKYTPLHLAAYGCHPELAELLVANNANINPKNEKGKTPLQTIKKRRYGVDKEKRKKLIEFLISKGAQ